MKTSDSYPPYQYLKSILTHCPRAGLLYMELWSLSDENLNLRIAKKNLHEVFLCSKTRLKNDLYALVREGLVSMEESSKDMIFELTGWDDESDA